MSLQTMYDVAPTFENWVKHGETPCVKEEVYRMLVPIRVPVAGGPYWCGFFVQAPWRTYVNYNDPRLIEKYYSQMKECLSMLINIQ